MDIEQAKATKAQLDKNITELLNKFSADTELIVEYINIEHQFTMGTSTNYIIATDVRLPK